MSTAERILKEAQKTSGYIGARSVGFHRIHLHRIKHGFRDRLTEELKQAQEPAMRHMWDNQDDEVWNGM